MPQGVPGGLGATSQEANAAARALWEKKQADAAAAAEAAAARAAAAKAAAGSQQAGSGADPEDELFIYGAVPSEATGGYDVWLAEQKASSTNSINLNVSLNVDSKKMPLGRHS